MNRTEAHPIELAIVAGLVVFDALLTLVIAAAALVLTLGSHAGGRMPRPAPRSAEPTLRAAARTPLRTVTAVEPRLHGHPQPHPLALLATELEALPAATLRQMAGIRSRRYSKAALIAMVAACG